MNRFLERFLSFDKMMAGSIVKILYYVLLAVTILGGIVATFQALFSGDFGRFLLTPVMTVLAVLFIRVICEMYIVLFRISDNLSAIRKLQEQAETIEDKT